MKVFFFISSVYTKDGGNGGHYYSLIETIRQVKKEHECEIINIGNEKASSLIKQDVCEVTFFNVNKNVYKTYLNLKEYFQNKEVDVIHSFDSVAHLWARRLANYKKVKLVLTKCGGANQMYYPYCENLICFSQENNEYFLSQRKYKSAKLWLIPNRIAEFSNDDSRIKHLDTCIKNEHRKLFKVFRIVRISTYYQDSLFQLIRLVKKINRNDVRCILIIIGTPDEISIIRKIEMMQLDYIYIFTESNFTKNAKELLAYSDMVLGTGRSLMEASSKGKILLAPLSDSKYPLLLDDTNFKEAFRYNFSERLKLNQFNEEQNYNNIEKVISDVSARKELQEFSLLVFKEFFDSSKILQKMNVIYGGKVKRESRYIDLFLNYLFVLKKIYFRKYN